MTFAQDYWKRVARTFYTAFAAVAGPLLIAHLAGAMEDVASGNWHALKSVAIAIGTAGGAAGWTAIKGLVAKGIGIDPEKANMKGAFSNGA